MNIYFAGSIRGGRVDVGLYHRMIEYLQGTDRVLTEHVGDMSLRESTTDAEIYTQDTAWLREADLLIAECTCPSLGVGYELAYAEHLGIPCHIFYDRSKTQLSAMLMGDAYFTIHPYGSEDEIYPVLAEILSTTGVAIKEARVKRVQEMEARLNRLKLYLSGSMDSVHDDVRALDVYLKSPQWLSDYEADERGELPSNLPRGVLSQDELYNALRAYDEQYR